MENYQHREGYERAKKQIKRMKSFYIHLAVYLVINIFASVTSFIQNGIEGLYANSLGIGLIWGVGLFFHWYNAIGNRLIYSKKWEERKIRELMKES